MKCRSLTFTCATLLLLPAAACLAAEDGEVSGSLELGVRAVDDENESAKFQEYRDLEDGLFGDLYINYSGGSHYLDIEGLNVGLDDQYFRLEGGDYGKFDYSFYYDEIPHNLSFGAITPYSGVGSRNLTINVADPAFEGGWREFNYSMDRKKYGGEVGVSLNSPFFINFGAGRMEKDGLKPLGTGSFSGQVEIPEPVDYTDDNFRITAGFRDDRIMVKVSGMMSSFENENNYLRWDNPFTADTEVNTLPPDNDYGKVSADLTWRKLPLGSTFLLSAGYANLSNDFKVSDIGIAVPAGLNRSEFEGDITCIDFSVSFISRPGDSLDTRLFYSYLDRDNDSSIIETISDSNADHLFEYRKNNLGADFNYDLGMRTLVGAGYEYLDKDRENRPDVDGNTDNRFFVKLRNSSLDLVTARLSYTYLDRDADSAFQLTGLTPNDAEFIEQFVRRFDNTSKEKKEIKLVLEVYPAENFDFGLEYTWAENDYDDVVLGRTADKGHEFYVDFSWRAARMLMISGFAGYETYTADSNHYNFEAGVAGQTADPRVEDGNPDSYLWTREVDDDFWTIGAMVRMPLMDDRLELSLGGDYQESDGKNTFSSQGASLRDIDEADDYDITSVEGKAIYSLTEALDLGFGYRYEKFDYDDPQYLGYEYQPSGSLLSGAYADHDFETHLGYFAVRYGF